MSDEPKSPGVSRTVSLDAFMRVCPATRVLDGLSRFERAWIAVGVGLTELEQLARLDPAAAAVIADRLRALMADLTSGQPAEPKVES